MKMTAQAHRNADRLSRALSRARETVGPAKIVVGSPREEELTAVFMRVLLHAEKIGWLLPGSTELVKVERDSPEHQAALAAATTIPRKLSDA